MSVPMNVPANGFAIALRYCLLKVISRKTPFVLPPADSSGLPVDVPQFLRGMTSLIEFHDGSVQRGFRFLEFYRCLPAKFYRKVAVDATFRPSIRCRGAVRNQVFDAAYFFLFLRSRVFKAVACPFTKNSVAERIDALSHRSKGPGDSGRFALRQCEMALNSGWSDVYDDKEDTLIVWKRNRAKPFGQ